jgi:hypothetical protein
MELWYESNRSTCWVMAELLIAQETTIASGIRFGMGITLRETSRTVVLSSFLSAKHIRRVWPFSRSRGRGEVEWDTMSSPSTTASSSLCVSSTTLPGSGTRLLRNLNSIDMNRRQYPPQSLTFASRRHQHRAIEFCKIEEFDSIKLLLDTAVYTAYPKCPTVNCSEFKKYRNFHTLYSMHSRRWPIREWKSSPKANSHIPDHLAIGGVPAPICILAPAQAATSA